MDKKIFAASLAFFDGDHVLLIKRAREPAKGMWTLPGGRCEAGESPENCIVREVFEEIGIRPKAPVGVTSIEPIPGFHLQVFAAPWPGGTIVPDAGEVADWAWVDLQDVASMRVTDGLADVLNLCRGRLGS